MQKGAYIQGIITGCIFCLQEDGPITPGWGSYKRRILYPRGLIIIEAKGGLHPGAYDQKFFLFTGRWAYNWVVGG